MAFDKTTQMANRYGLTTKFYAYSGTPATALATIDFVNISNIEVSGDAVWATGGQGRSNLVAYNNPVTGSFTLSTQIQTMELLTLMAGKDLATATTTVIFENSSTTVIPKYYKVVSETVWQDADGAVYEETITFHKVKANRAYNIAYDGGADPVSVDVAFELSQNDDGEVMTVSRKAKDTSSSST